MIRIFLFLLFLSFSLQGCHAQGNEGAAAEDKNTDPYTWDFGQVKEGRVVTHEFVLKNDSEKEMRIGDVSTSCGCTASRVATKILLPGESTEIEVKFNSKGYSGAVQQYIYVHTDTLDKSIIRFIIKAHVIR